MIVIQISAFITSTIFPQASQMTEWPYPPLMMCDIFRTRGKHELNTSVNYQNYLNYIGVEVPLNNPNTLEFGVIWNKMTDKVMKN